MISALNRVFKLHGISCITNIDFSPLKGDTITPPYMAIPHSVENAKTFKNMKDLKSFLHAKQVKTSVTVKCAWKNDAIIGKGNTRKVPQYAIYGSFQNGDFFQVTDFRIKGKGQNAHFTGIKQAHYVEEYAKQTWRMCGDNLITVTQEAQEKAYKKFGTEWYNNHLELVNVAPEKAQLVYTPQSTEVFTHEYYQWEKFDIPVKSTVGTLIYWFTFLDVPKVIPVKEANTIKNNTIKFPDKRGYTKPAPNGIKTGVTSEGGKSYFVPNTGTQKLYSVKYLKDNEVVWRTQNESQVKALCKQYGTTKEAMIAKGDIVEK